MTRPLESHDVVEWVQAVLASDDDLLAELLRLGLEALMEAERDAYVGAAPHARGEERRTHRNGDKPRTLTTRVGRLELKVTDGPFSEAKEVVGGYALCEANTHDEAVALATKFMDLHRIHWPELEGETEVRPLEDTSDQPAT